MKAKKYRIPAEVSRKLNMLCDTVHFRRVKLESKPDTALGELTVAMVGAPDPKEPEKLEASIERMSTELVGMGFTHQVNLIRANAHRSSWDYGPGEYEAYLEEFYGTPPVDPAARNVASTEYPQVRKLLKNL